MKVRLVKLPDGSYVLQTQQECSGAFFDTEDGAWTTQPTVDIATLSVDEVAEIATSIR